MKTRRIDARSPRRFYFILQKVVSDMLAEDAGSPDWSSRKALAVMLRRLHNPQVIGKKHDNPLVN